MLKHISDEKEKTNVDIRDAADIMRQLVRLDKNAEKMEDRMKLFKYLIASANDEDFLAQLRKNYVLSTWQVNYWYPYMLYAKSIT